MARNSSTVVFALSVSLVLHIAALAIPSLPQDENLAGAATAITVSLRAGSSATQEEIILGETVAPTLDQVVENASDIKSKDVAVTTTRAPTSTAPFLPIYFTASELHQRPIPLQTIDLAELHQKYPEISGTFSILINERGAVDKVHFLDGNTSKPTADFSEFLANLHFVPGKIAGQAVRSEIQIRIERAKQPLAATGTNTAPNAEQHNPISGERH